MAECVCSSAFNENNNSSEFPSLVNNSSEISKDDSASEPSLSPKTEVKLLYLLTPFDHYANLLSLLKSKILCKWVLLAPNGWVTITGTLNSSVATCWTTLFSMKIAYDVRGYLCACKCQPMAIVR